MTYRDTNSNKTVHDGKRTNLPQYRSTFGALRHIISQEGFRGTIKRRRAAIKTTEGRKEQLFEDTFFEELVSAH